MTDFQIIEVEETTYLYVDRESSTEQQEIGAAMADAFGMVWTFMQENKIKPAGAALSVYYSYTPGSMAFRAGFTIFADDADKSGGEVKAGTTPAGKVVHFLHTGPYSELVQCYAEMMEYIAENDLKLGVPTWEVYLNDPSTVAESELQTEVFAALD